MKPYLQCRRKAILRWRYCRSFTTTRRSDLPFASAHIQENDKSLDFLTEETRDKKPKIFYTPTEIIEETKKHASTSKSQSILPQSPLTDPDLTAARLRHKAPKDRQTKYQDLSRWRARLHKNPYAQILASPTRECVLTGAHLPAECLLRFGLVIDPRTGRKWQLPRFLGAGKKAQANDATSSSTESLAEQDGKEVTQQKDEHGTSKDVKKSNSDFRTMSSVYSLSTHQAMRTTSLKNRLSTNRALPATWIAEPAVDKRRVIFREDMADVVLQHMRAEVAEELERIGKSGFVEVCHSVDGLDGHELVGAVLSFPLLKEEHQDGDIEPQDEKTRDRKDIDPARRPEGGVKGVYHHLIRWRRKHVPLYDMSALLGPSVAAGVQASMPEGSGEGPTVVVLRAKRKTEPLQRRLWGLLGYIADRGVSPRWDDREGGIKGPQSSLS